MTEQLIKSKVVETTLTYDKDGDVVQETKTETTEYYGNETITYPAYPYYPMGTYVTTAQVPLDETPKITL